MEEAAQRLWGQPWELRRPTLTSAQTHSTEEEAKVLGSKAHERLLS